MVLQVSAFLPKCLNSKKKEKELGVVHNASSRLQRKIS